MDIMIKNDNVVEQSKSRAELTAKYSKLFKHGWYNVYRSFTLFVGIVWDAGILTFWYIHWHLIAKHNHK
jgi:hypothetical protein